MYKQRFELKTPTLSFLTDTGNRTMPVMMGMPGRS